MVLVPPLATMLVTSLGGTLLEAYQPSRVMLFVHWTVSIGENAKRNELKSCPYGPALMGTCAGPE